LHAFRKVARIYKDYHLVFAGPDGGMEAALKAMAIEINLEERVHFIGYVGGSDKVAAYRGAALIVVPSRQEAMSIVALEAGICGKPVLMTDQCGFGILEDLGAGLVVAPTEEGLQAGLLSILHDTAKLEEMGARLKNHVEERYTWTAAAKACIELFQRVLDPARQ
jgi:glycosyltransferase involved in cell wall biosynthesis